MITIEQFKKIFPNCPKDKVETYLKNLNLTMDRFKIDTKLRKSHFLAQGGHESYQFKFMEEIWGPTDQQKKYEPPSAVAKNLGNTEKGDGFKYKGRGMFQITGRANYKQISDYFGFDFIKNPEKAATPEWAFLIAGWYWENRKLNDLADKDDITAITKKINGGLTHIEDRKKYYAKCIEVL